MKCHLSKHVVPFWRISRKGVFKELLQGNKNRSILKSFESRVSQSSGISLIQNSKFFGCTSIDTL